MTNLKFTRITILSSSTKSANQFDFHERLNLVTAQDNSVGKSTLVKLLFWTFGCEPAFDTTWSALDVKSLVGFTVADVSYTVLREGNLMTLKEGTKPAEKYSKITGEYSKRIAGIMNFQVLLPNSAADSLETPPPAYYFLPFYIDQKRGWGKPWDSFERLEQYSNWKSPVTKYHVGLLGPEHFEKQVEISKIVAEKTGLDIEVGRRDTALDIVNSYLINTKAVISSERLDEIREELEVELKDLAEEQEKIFDQIYKYENETAFLKQQTVLSEKVVKEFEADYKFAVENLPQEIICPMCGVLQDNSIVNRASLLVDKKKAISLSDEITFSYTVATRRLNQSKESLRAVQKRIEAINEKYTIEEGGNTIGIENISQAIGAKSIALGINNERATLVSQVHDAKSNLRRLKKEQKALSLAEVKEAVETQFMAQFLSNLKVLHAEGVNLSDVSSPLDYSKIFKAGGAAESTRAVLAYFLSVFSLIYKFGHEVVSPLVIDTPNQHEQSIGNYESIVNLLMQNVDKDTQIILCGMDNEQLSAYKSEANIITLNEQRLMDTKKYSQLESSFVLE